MPDLTTAYDAEVKRRAELRDPYGQDAEMPRVKLGGGTLAANTLMGRIGDLAKQVTEAAHMLAEARDQHQRAAVGRQKAEHAFAAVSEALVQAIHEHREGTPENAPYQP